MYSGLVSVLAVQVFTCTVLTYGVEKKYCNNKTNDEKLLHGTVRYRYGQSVSQFTQTQSIDEAPRKKKERKKRKKERNPLQEGM